MGQLECIADGQAPDTPPEVDMNRRRQDYLHRLGIDKEDKVASVGSFLIPFETATKAEQSEVEDSEEASSSKFAPSRIDLQSHNAFRINFLQKLSYSKVWLPPAQ